MERAVAVARRKTAEVNLMDPDFNLRSGIQVEGFDLYVLVYKDRSFENPSVYAAADGQVNPPLDEDRDPRFLYSVLSPDPYAPNPMPFPNPRIISSTGTILLADPVDIQNDEWIMLVNHDQNGQAQVGFFRVIGSDPRINAITIEGADFEVQNNLTNGDLSHTPTYAIYLRNVVNVYKRQLTVESGPN